VCLAFRLVHLNTIPGLSGDEAEIAVKLKLFLNQEPVQWKGPTGKYLSPIFLAFIAPFQILIPPSVLAIRLPGVVAGIGVVLLSFFLLLRSYGRYPALITTLLLAASPMVINYSRLTIEQSLVCPAVVVVLHYTARHDIKGTLISIAVALLLHPINVFLIPIVLTQFGYLFYISSWEKEKKLRFLKWTVGLSAIAITAIILYTPSHYLSVQGPVGRLLDGAAFWKYLTGFVGAISGVTVIEDFAGGMPASPRLLLNLTFAFLLAVGLFLGLPQLWQKKRYDHLSFIVGWLLMAFGYYLIAGQFGVRMGEQRHALILIVPSMLAIALLWEAIAEQALTQKIFLWSGSAVAWLMIFQFGKYYLQEFQKTGGSSHPIYKTAKIEPKVEVFFHVKQLAGNRPTQVLTEDWWTYQPLRYLALPHETLNVLPMSVLNRDITALKQIMEKGGILVGWHGKTFDQLVRQLYHPSQVHVQTIRALDNSPLLKVWKLRTSG